ncbi:MAG: hypothetical protein Ta2B_02270 [Termitinemataceae bacterium]|nr:MAG: hypothetical protein Ta2B_02270 [Termitinemataceae bacterium]
MKKGVLLTFFVLALSQFGYSQVFLGGSVSYTHTSTKASGISSDRNIVELSPMIGYRFNNFDAGLSFLYQEDTFTSNSEKTNSLGFNIFSDYIFLQIDKFSISGRVAFQYLHSKYSVDDDTGAPKYIPYNIEENVNVIGISVLPIFKYRIFDHIALYASIGSISFSHLWGEVNINSSQAGFKQTDDISQDSFDLSLSTRITIGFYVFL